MNNRKWQPKEDAFLKENYDKVTAAEIGKKLNRTLQATRKRTFDIGLSKTGKYNTATLWNTEDLNFILKNYWCMSVQQLAKKLNVKRGRVESKIVRLHLKKEAPEEVKREVVRLLTDTNFPLEHIAKQTGLSIGRIRKLTLSLTIRRSIGVGWHNNSLTGFKFNGHRTLKARNQVLYVYKNTCWDCKRTLLPAALVIHHDWSSLPIKVYVLCRQCHQKRHGVNRGME